MSKTWKGIIRIVAIVLGPMLRAVTPLVKEALQEGLDHVYEEAVETDNPIDDLFMGFVYEILGLTKPEVER